MLQPKEKVKPPRNLRSARLSVVKNKISTPISIPVTQYASLAPPRKVIKALYDYQAQNGNELSFARGDFFHVTARENDPQWYEACNPATNSRGLVPVTYFQVLEKNDRSTSEVISPVKQKADSGFRMQPLYGIVLYDFQAERSDEMDAKAGEPIIVIAQSNQEWFVAKPIGRLGGPGLIPVSFVEIRDAVTGKTITNVNDLMHTSAAPIPRVEEWKKMTQGYEASSISLANGGSAERPMDDRLGVVSATIDSYILEADQYWFIVYAHFYDFQINLLHEFQIEAGKADRERILPYMPGPLSHVDEKITAERQQDLNKYCEELLALPRYISQSVLVQNQLFGIHEGDIETDNDPRIGALRFNSQDMVQTSSTPIASTVKLKIVHKEDIFAIKVPVDSTLEGLRKKVHERLGFEVRLRYKSEPHGDHRPLEDEKDMEEAFTTAVKLGKLTVYAE
ncbi:uncharacterized protein BYT42DRAFT_498483 [Radiomyces spectabilis]|uniref:uncharacterized protein n=1 Tax=Radiomyces spectabilis TaxID=64574 RepID=UPI00221EBEC3|nr:uncharacterized protein BYT42DRAFT_498483 [Radiomyces spectabilis]KAI8376510.1 hypothetical protein BYT42DRAFT_498483 [Radiomyces spectabilis]